MIEQFYLTMDGTLERKTTPDENRPKNNGNEVVFHIPKYQD